EGPEAELVPLVFEDVPGLAVLVELPARHLEAGHEKVAGGARVDHHVARGVAGIETLRLGLDGFVLVLGEEPAGDAARDAALSERQALGDLGDEVAEVPEREDAVVAVAVMELLAGLGYGFHAVSRLGRVVAQPAERVHPALVDDHEPAE